ncbi:MAG: hypothetical protein IKV93_01875 [Alphaproteobacteria bacterium]|nr:hypothetical protein [Alphaproteobacteria bacterium]
MKQQPLFSMTTAYKRMIGFHRVDNSVYALMIYMVGDGVTINGLNQVFDSLYGVEKYEFPNTKYCDLGAGLFDKVMDYENFLCQENVYNEKVRALSKPWIEAFDIKYNDKSKASWWKRLTAKNIEEQAVVMHPYEKHHVWCVPENSHDLVGIENVRPVFKSAYQQSSKDIVYVYELELINAINIPNMYFGKPCINIALFNNADTANQYIAQSVIEQQKFAKHKEYQELQDKCMPAIMRFDMFTNSKNMSR